MIKKQVNLATAPAYNDLLLPSDESESGPHLKQKVGDILRKGFFQFGFVVNFVTYGRKDEIVVLFQHLLNQLALQIRQFFTKIVDNLALMTVKARLDAVLKRWTT